MRFIGAPFGMLLFFRAYHHGCWKLERFDDSVSPRGRRLVRKAREVALCISGADHCAQQKCNRNNHFLTHDRFFVAEEPSHGDQYEQVYPRTPIIQGPNTIGPTTCVVQICGRCDESTQNLFDSFTRCPNPELSVTRGARHAHSARHAQFF